MSFDEMRLRIHGELGARRAEAHAAVDAMFDKVALQHEAAFSRLTRDLMGVGPHRDWATVDAVKRDGAVTRERPEWRGFFLSAATGGRRPQS